jgi:hypothetical protein
VSRATEIYSREFELLVPKLHLGTHAMPKKPSFNPKRHSQVQPATGRQALGTRDQQKNILYLLTLGHRREIYR